eukprot:COSAG06_NODE_7478_length_2491_cov_1.714883_2_plen_386_part_00
MVKPWEWSLATLETIMAGDQMNLRANLLRALSVVELWRLRRVCSAFHRWGTEVLAALPRPMVVGGSSDFISHQASKSVEVLDLSTLQWSSGLVPALPEPRGDHLVCSFGDGRVVVAGGHGDWILDGPPDTLHTARQWTHGATVWMPLPDMVEARCSAAAVTLHDGRAMVIGGNDNHGHELASVEVLASDGSSWSTLTPMGMARSGHVAAVLPCDKVLVAGGAETTHVLAAEPTQTILQTAELWDPATGMWTELPPMIHARWGAGCCVLPSGRVAVIGGSDGGSDGKQEGWRCMDDNGRVDGEVFDPALRTWQLLPSMAIQGGRFGPGVVAAAGGLLVMGGLGHWHDRDRDLDELYDEASDRWFQLPHSMSRLDSHGVVASLGTCV